MLWRCCARGTGSCATTGQMLAAMVEGGYATPPQGPGRSRGSASRRRMPRMRSRCAWTCRAANREHYCAETLVQRMPAVFAALDTGRIDRGKAWIFTDFCAELTAEHTEVGCQGCCSRMPGG